MSLQLAVLVIDDFASASLSWLGLISLATVVAMVLLELGKCLPGDHLFRRVADRATGALVVLAIEVIVVSGYRLVEIIGLGR
jgi:hypothetical protein